MARIKGPRKIHQYSVEFKLKAVKLSDLADVQVQDVADALDIHPFMLSRWRKEAREGRLRARVAVVPAVRESREACRRLASALSGEATLETMEPTLRVRMAADGLGHISVKVEITPDHLTQQHHFEFQIDRACLADFVRQLESVLQKNPLRGVERQSAT